MPVDTAKAPRRELAFRCLGCLRTDLDAIQRAHESGMLSTTGNWNAGQVLDHCAILFECGLDGAKAPTPLMGRLFGKLVKRSLLKPATMKPGFKLPKDAAALLPRTDVTFDQGMARLRQALERLDAGERMTHPSSFLGPLTHDEWVRLNLNHTQLHLGFLAFPENR